MKIAQFRLRILFVAALALAFGTPVTETFAERPTAMKLFPRETLVFVRVAHGRELYERFQQTQGGQFFSDPELAPFIEDSIATARDVYTERVADETKLDWDDLSRIPKGEIAFGMVARSSGQPQVLMLVDFDGEQADAEFLLEKIHERLESQGVVIQEEEFAGDTLVLLKRGETGNAQFGYVLKDSCMIGSSDQTLLRQALDRWNEREITLEEDVEPFEDGTFPGEQTLAENPDFVAILRECSTQLEEPPQALFYVDPIGLVRNVTRGNVGAAIGLAILPQLGLDGIHGVGGTVSLATEKWDVLTHLHLLLGNPRSGVLTLLRFQQGDHTPPSYVPSNVFGYTSAYLDAPGIMERLHSLVDKFRYEGAFADTIEEGPSDTLGVDFEEVFINNLAGRVTLVTSFDEGKLPEQRALGMTLKDVTLTSNALKEIKERFADSLDERSVGGVDYSAVIPRFARQLPEEDMPFIMCFGIIDQTLVVTTSPGLMESLIATHQGTNAALAESEAYANIQSRVERLTSGRELAIFHYEDSAAAFRHWFNLANNERTLDRLADIEERFPLAGRVLDVLDRNQLPPFENLEKHFSPQGGYLLDTDTGLHYMGFVERMETDSE